MNHLYQTEQNKIYEKRIDELTRENILLLKELQYLIDACMDASLAVRRAQELNEKYFKYNE